MSLSDYYTRQIPEYYPTMYQDGFTPTQIMVALRKKMYKELLAPKDKQPNEVKITSEVTIK
ncbi:MAG: hypothetical protein KIG65_05725 [Eubacteriales bacterium]|nr:hypothetical protein [Eubacteriales bacterium]